MSPRDFEPLSFRGVRQKGSCVDQTKFNHNCGFATGRVWVREDLRSTGQWFSGIVPGTVLYQCEVADTIEGALSKVQWLKHENLIP